MWEKTNTYRVLMGKPVRDYLENICADGKIIFKLIFEKQDGREWIGDIWTRTG
jgi:hypothetical protein